jgi:virginiamycin A acetyltransferase
MMYGLDTTVAGNPSKLIRFRFNEEKISQLLKIQWWHWPHERIIESIYLLSGKDIDRFIATVLHNQSVSV